MQLTASPQLIMNRGPVRCFYTAAARPQVILGSGGRSGSAETWIGARCRPQRRPVVLLTGFLQLVIELGFGRRVEQ